MAGWEEVQRPVAQGKAARGRDLRELKWTRERSEFRSLWVDFEVEWEQGEWFEGKRVKWNGPPQGAMSEERESQNKTD